MEGSSIGTEPPSNPSQRINAKLRRIQAVSHRHHDCVSLFPWRVIVRRSTAYQEPQGIMPTGEPGKQ